MRGASRTAQYVALFRALESVRPPEERLFEDPLARTCLDGRLGRVADLARVPGIERTRVFEVEHPETQAAKRERVRERFGADAPHVAYVPVDFDCQDLATELAAAGLQDGARTFFVLEGVISYLTADAVDATFRTVAGSGRPGSQIAFTYLHRGVIDGSREIPGSGQAQDRVAAAGEPWRFGFDPAEVPGYLAARGLELIEDVSPAEAAPRYVRAEHRPAAAFYRLCRAGIVRK